VIEKIIKRDGREEKFDAEKIVRWAEWASPMESMKRQWPVVVTKVASRLDRIVTSKKLQEELIEGFLDLDNYSAYLVAGRLYSAHLRKEIFGSNEVPTIKEVQTRLIQDGLLRDLGYSDQEYQMLEEIIDHERDFDVLHFSLHHIRLKYALRNKVSKKEYETQQFVYMRMAMTVNEFKEPIERIALVKSLYDKLSQKKLSLPTPNYVNFGTYLRSYASCNLYMTDDNLESLAIGDHIAYRQTAASAGNGFNIMTRSADDPIRNGLFPHQGKLPYYAAVGKAIKANLQNGRGGAGNAFFPAFDPEANKILGLRDPRSTGVASNRDLHYTFMDNPFFAKKVAAGEKVFVWNCYTAPKLNELFYSDDLKGFIEEYNRLENDPSFHKEYIDTRELFYRLKDAEFGSGTYYEMDAYEVNRHTPLKEPIHSSNLCVAPETQLLTDQGHVTIRDKAGQTVTIWNGKEWSEVEVVKTGENQKLLRVVLSDGKDLTCTPYHKWYVMDSYQGKEREVRTHELEEGMKLIKLETPVIEGDWEFKRAYVNGFYTGDGTQLYNGTGKIYLYGEKAALAPLFNHDKEWRKNGNRLESEFRDLYPKYTVPTVKYTVASRLEWLAGWLDADGCIYRNGDNESITASSTDKEFLKEVQLMLQTLGIESKVTLLYEAGIKRLPANDGTGIYKDFYCLATYRLLISSWNSQKLLELGLKLHRLVIEKRKVQRSASGFVYVKNVLDVGRVDDTYCVKEPKRNRAVFNGILTGQCVEITEHTAPYYDMKDLYSEEDHGRGEIALCNLGAVNLSKIESDKDYFNIMYEALKVIDYTIDHADYTFPHLSFTSKQRRYAAVGIMDFAHVMAESHYSYSTEEGRQFMHEVAERHMYFAIKASLAISKERGVAPWIHKTKWVDGWTPVKTYNRGLDSIQDFKYRYDWEALSEEIKANGGIAHSLLVAYMPGEASSKAVGAANSIYPVRQLTLVKTDNKITTRWAAPNGDNEFYKYESAWDIPTKDLIIMYAIFQKFTDQSISADRYKRVPEGSTINTDELIEEYLLAKKLGVKTFYYQNSNTASNVDINVVERITDAVDEEVCEGCTM